MFILFLIPKLAIIFLPAKYRNRFCQEINFVFFLLLRSACAIVGCALDRLHLGNTKIKIHFIFVIALDLHYLCIDLGCVNALTPK